MIHHRLLTELTGRLVAIELQAALSGCGGAKLRIVHDHGSEFCNTELRAVIKAHDLLDIRNQDGSVREPGAVRELDKACDDRPHGFTTQRWSLNLAGCTASSAETSVRSWPR